MDNTPTKDEFEKFYERSNPWNLDGKFSDRVRIKILRNVFEGVSFESGIDIACGEGYLTSRLDFIKNRYGVDISEKAIERAKKSYPDVYFYSGDAFNDKCIENKFDFVSCFEALYYPYSDKDRRSALINILEYGNEGATYVFSVVTVGANKHRRYFTKEEFSELLESSGYELQNTLGFVLNSVPIIFRLVKKVLNFCAPVFIENLFAYITIDGSEKEMYQHLFICSKKKM